MIPLRRIVLLLLALQVASTAFLWTLDDLNEISEGTFALFLGVDLMSFAMISYSYRKERQLEIPSKTWLLIGCLIIMALLFSSLFLH